MIDGGYRQHMTDTVPHVARLKELHKTYDPKHYTIADDPAQHGNAADPTGSS
jgi:hypothetical protein